MPLADFGLCCAMNEFGQKFMSLFYFVTYNVYRKSIAVVKKINVEFSTEILFSLVRKISGSNKSSHCVFPNLVQKLIN